MSEGLREQQEERVRVFRLKKSLEVVQWLGLWASTAGGMGSNPGQGTKIPHALQCSQRITRQLASSTLLFTCVRIQPWSATCKPEEGSRQHPTMVPP